MSEPTEQQLDESLEVARAVVMALPSDGKLALHVAVLGALCLRITADALKMPVATVALRFVSLAVSMSTKTDEGAAP